MPLYKIIFILFFFSSYSSLANEPFSPQIVRFQSGNVAHCTIYVSNTNSNFSKIYNQLSFFTFSQAITAARPGDVLCLAEKANTDVIINNIHGTKDAPITIQPFIPTSARIKSLDFHGANVHVKNSSYVVVSGFNISGGLYGIQVTDSSNIILKNNKIYDIGQEGIIIKASSNSNNIIIDKNIIHDTGLSDKRYGEGIYIGNNEENSGIIDGLSIINNTVYDTSNEAIDIKPNVRNVEIINNTIYNIDLAFNGAITIATSAKNKINGKYLIKRNYIYNFSNRNGYLANAISIGNGNAYIENNHIWNNISGVGIYGYTTFTNTTYNNVYIKDNIFSDKIKPVVEKGGNGGTGVNFPGTFIIN